MTPPVAESPRPPEPADEKTDPRILAAITKHVPPPSRLKDLVVAIGAVLGAVVVSIIFVDNRVEAQTKRNNEVQEAKAEAMRSRVSTLEQRFDRFEDRTDKQMNLALDALRVPHVVRPPPIDGGAP